MQVQSAEPTPRGARASGKRKLRECLAPLYAGHYETPEEIFQYVQAELTRLAYVVKEQCDLDEREKALCEERQRKRHVALWEAAAHAVYLEEEDLLRVHGYVKAEDYLEANWSYSKTHVGNWPWPRLKARIRLFLPLPDPALPPEPMRMVPP